MKHPIYDYRAQQQRGAAGRAIRKRVAIVLSIAAIAFAAAFVAVRATAGGPEQKHIAVTVAIEENPWKVAAATFTAITALAGGITAWVRRRKDS